MHLRHVARYQQPLAFAVGHHAELHMQLVVHHQRQRTGKLLLAQIARKLRIAQQVKDILAVIFRPAQPQMLLRGRCTRK